MVVKGEAGAPIICFKGLFQLLLTRKRDFEGRKSAFMPYTKMITASEPFENDSGCIVEKLASEKMKRNFLKKELDGCAVSVE